MKRKFIVIVICLMFFILFPTLVAKIISFLGNLFMSPLKWFNNETETSVSEPESDTYKVLRVIDGDTIVVYMRGDEIKVRLIGVDTPESVHEDESRNCEEGKIASRYTRDLLTGKRVKLEYDVQKEDVYGRTLAYVYLTDGRMLQNILLEVGYARVATYPPNVANSKMFTEVQKKAIESEKGFWSHDIWK